MDDCLECTEAGHTSCASLTDFLIGTDYQGYASTSIYRPIYSRESTTVNGTAKVLGFTTVGFDWATELVRLSADALGVDCVLRSPHSNSSFTYNMRNGKVRQKVGGDRHDRNFDSMAVNIPLSLLGSFAKDSATFVMDIYPTSQYQESFHSHTPLYTSLGLAGMIIFTSVVFFLYDQLVKEDVKEKAHVLRMKRDFVRFISHEIRTPLNTVAVGMTLLEEGLQMMHIRETLAEQLPPKSGDGNGCAKDISKSHHQDDRDIDDCKSSVMSGLSDQRDMSVTDMLELTSDVQNSTTVAVSVLNDLLNFDKLEAGEVKMAYDRVMILELVSHVVKSFKIQAYQKKIQMSLDFKGVDNASRREVVVYGDKFKLSHVIRNLMSNALKFTERYGAITVTISVYRPSLSADVIQFVDDDHVPPPQAQKTEHCLPIMNLLSRFRDDPEHFSRSASYNDGNRDIWGINSRRYNNGMILVAVKDSGHGLSPDQLSALFQDGVQFDPNKLQAGQGSGLGLFLSQKIVAVHGGRIWAESKGQGMGATFFMSLPLGQTIPATENASPAAGVLSNGTNHYNSARCNRIRNVEPALESDLMLHNDAVHTEESPLRQGGIILVVDDAASNRKIVKRVLRSRGFDCMEAKDGQECIRIVREMAPSVNAVDKCTTFCCILMDFEMPILNGPDTTLALRDLGYKYPIFGLTGNVMQEDVQHFLESGADHVLSKPFEIAEFLGVYDHINDV